MKNKFVLTYISIFLLLSASCKKLVDPGSPKDGIDAASAYRDNANASASVTGIFSDMAIGGFSNGGVSFSILCGLSADEYHSNFSDISKKQLYVNALLSDNFITGQIWSELYSNIYAANAAIEGLSSSPGVSDALKAQLMGEVRFIRAFDYFYLVNLFGDVPMPLSTDYRVNRLLPRTPAAGVYDQIVNDLKEAQSLLNDEYLTPDNKITTERVRPNKATATAMLARVYLYLNKWQDAEEQATAIIDKSTQYDLQPLNAVFLMNSKEAIWQLPSIIPGYNTLDAFAFVLISDPLDQKVTLANGLLNSFEEGDNRSVNWVGSYNGWRFAYKYKVRDFGSPVSEYLMVLRLAEQYLIRAEARIQQEKIPDGIADLNVIRARARATPTMAIPDPLPDLSAALSKEDALLAVYHERQIELFSEWGHRWLDLKRTGRADAVMPAAAADKGGVWDTTDQLYPIPVGDFRSNPNLRPQNPGYN